MDENQGQKIDNFQEGSSGMFSLVNLPATILCLLIAVLPVFFMPVSVFPVQLSKVLLVSAGIIAVVLFFILSSLKRGNFSLSWSYLAIASIGIPVVYFISSIFNSPAGMSIFGYGFETSTASFALLMVVLLWLSMGIFDSQKKILSFYLLFFLSFFVISIFHLIRLAFGAQALSFGIFTNMVSNTVGSWNDLGIFFGIFVILSLVALELLPLERLFKGIIYAVFAVALAFMIIINFSTSFAVLGAFALAFFVYLFYSQHSQSHNEPEISYDGAPDQKSKKVSVLSLIVLCVAVLWVFLFKLPLVTAISGGDIGNKISTALNISNIEARPSWTSTWQVGKKVFSESPLLGTGPNKFVNGWLLHKPQGINLSQFWNTDFNYGVGLLPTFIISTGILGLLAWLVFFVAFAFAGFKAVFSKVGNPFSHYLTIASFSVALYLWVMDFLYIPGTTLLVLSFFFTGLFIASAQMEDSENSHKISFSRNSKSGSFFILCLVVVIIASVGFGYLSLKKVVSLGVYSKGMSVYGAGNLEGSEALVLKALNISSSDMYYRSLADINIQKIQNEIANAPENPSDAQKNKVIQLFNSAFAFSENSIKADPTNYLNYLTLARYYETVLRLGGDKAFENAKNAYGSAEKYYPSSPYISLSLARLELSASNSKKAREYIYEALKRKSNYTEAMFLLSQVEASENNLPQAIAPVESASVLSPNDPSIFFQLGILKYTNKDYGGAIIALERAVALVPEYSNARYFLGLSYEKIGRQKDAIVQFKEIQKLNPDNKEVQAILSNLLAGKSSSAVSEPTVSKTKPKSLPIKEGVKGAE